MNEAQEDKVIESPEFPLPTAKLMDEEAKTLTDKRAQLSRVAVEMENILIREDMNMGDLANIMDLFNARAHAVFSLTKIKDMKQIYEQQQ